MPFWGVTCAGRIGLSWPFSPISGIFAKYIREMLYDGPDLLDLGDFGQFHPFHPGDLSDS